MAPSRLSRRTLVLALAGAPALLLVNSRTARAQAAAAPGVCAAPDSDGMRATLAYLEVSPYGAEKNCLNCHLWQKPVAGASCGGCGLIDGAIDPNGYCDSWALPGTQAATAGAAAGATSAPSGAAQN